MLALIHRTRRGYDGYTVTAVSNGEANFDNYVENSGSLNLVKAIIYYGSGGKANETTYKTWATSTDPKNINSTITNWDKYYEVATQQAIWKATNGFALGSDDIGKLAQKIFDDASANTSTAASKVSITVYKPDNGQPDRPGTSHVQNVITYSVSGSGNAPVIKNTTLTATYNGTASEAGDSPAAVTIPAGSSSVAATLTDKVEYSGIDTSSGDTYKIRCELYDKEDTTIFVEQVDSEKIESASGSVTISFTAIDMTDGKEYSVKTMILKNGAPITSTTHNDGLNLARETVKATAEQESEPTTPTLKTTVSAGGKSGSSSKAATLTAAEAKSVTMVTDTITYSNMKPQTAYIVNGTLNEVKDGSVVDTVATASDEFNTEEGFGTWELTFIEVKLEPGKTYVVFETAVNQADDTDVVKHENVGDKAQTIVVEKEMPDKPDEPDKPDKPDKPSKGGGGEETIPVVHVLHYTTHVSGTKTWTGDEAGNRPASITVNLFSDGEKVDSRTVTGEGNTWVFDFGERPLYKEGNPIQYTLTEDPCENYEAGITATVNKVETETGSTVLFAVTNTYIAPAAGDRAGAGRPLSANRATGDESLMYLWGTIALSALLILATMFKRRTR